MTPFSENEIFQLMILPSIPIIIMLIVFVYSSQRKSSLPPGPYPWPILGNILHMGKKPHINLTNFSKTYGPIISLKLGSQVVIVGSSPQVASEILKTHDRILSGTTCGRDHTKFALDSRSVPHIMPAKNPEVNKLSMGWSFECGNTWKNLRTICRTELFSGKILDCQAHLREEKASEMINFLKKMEGNTVDIAEIVFTTVFSMLSSVLLSKDLINYADHDCETKGMVRKIMEMATIPNLADFFWVFSRLDVQKLKVNFADLRKKIMFVWKNIVDERRARKIDNNELRSENLDFLDVLIDKGFGDDQINSLLLELFTAGTDTTTSTIEWAMAELIRNPVSLKKVRDELKEELGSSKTLQESNLQNLHYLQASIKETLRLHPPVPFLLPHRAVESCQLMNYTIPENSKILINVWAIGRDPTIWVDPLSFKPERFLSSKLDFKGHDFEFIPFSSGRSLCPGLPMAAKAVPLILGSLINNFEWSLPDGVDTNEIDISEKFGVTLQKESPLLLVPRLRI